MSGEAGEGRGVEDLRKKNAWKAFTVKKKSCNTNDHRKCTDCPKKLPAPLANEKETTVLFVCILKIGELCVVTK